MKRKSFGRPQARTPTPRRNTINNDEQSSRRVRARTPMQRKRTATANDRRNSTMSTTTASMDLDQNVPNSMLRDFVLQTTKMGIDGLVREFNELKVETGRPPALKTAFDANPEKNRYKDVYCQDQTRVILKMPIGSNNDYIHANWVSIKGEKRFICSQGPTEKTVDDFWRMIWENKVQGIAQLCNIFEQGRKKCEEYYPSKPGEPPIITSSGIVIKNTASSELEKILTVSMLEMSVDGSEPFIVRHYFWNSWPDRGVPSNIMACLRLLARIKTLSPVVVHCSAGIGRTGTIVGLEMCQQTIMAGEPLSMLAVVRELRSYRHGAVQTDIQYVYMHRVMMGLAENKKVVTQDEITPFYDSYETFLKSRGC